MVDGEGDGGKDGARGGEEGGSAGAVQWLQRQAGALVLYLLPEANRARYGFRAAVENALFLLCYWQLTYCHRLVVIMDAFSCLGFRDMAYALRFDASTLCTALLHTPSSPS